MLVIWLLRLSLPLLSIASALLVSLLSLSSPHCFFLLVPLHFSVMAEIKSSGLCDGGFLVWWVVQFMNHVTLGYLHTEGKDLSWIFLLTTLPALVLEERVSAAQIQAMTLRHQPKGEQCFLC